MQPLEECFMGDKERKVYTKRAFIELSPYRFIKKIKNITNRQEVYFRPPDKEAGSDLADIMHQAKKHTILDRRKLFKK